MQNPEGAFELERDRIYCSCLAISGGSLSSDCSSSSLGDHIGMESCVDLCGTGKDDGDRVGKAESKRFEKRNHRWMVKEREFPPPIPLLARTENLSSHMPWVLRRQYTSDGRLILTEEKVKHHEYFKAHRSNGRLTLHLVPLDHDDLCLLPTPPPPFADGSNEVESEINNVGDDHDGIEQIPAMGGSGKCLNYDNARASSSPCRFGVPVPAARIVHS